MQVVVQFALVHQLRVLGVGRFKLDGHLEVGLGVDALEDLPEGPLIELADDLVVPPHFLRNLWHVASNKKNDNSKIKSLNFS